MQVAEIIRRAQVSNRKRTPQSGGLNAIEPVGPKPIATDQDSLPGGRIHVDKTRQTPHEIAILQSSIWIGRAGCGEVCWSVCASR